MPDPNQTLPPTTVQKVEADAKKTWDFVKLHWLWCGPLIGVAVGWVLGKVF